MRSRVRWRAWTVLVLLGLALTFRPVSLQAKVKPEQEQAAAKLWTGIKAHLDREEELKAAKLAVKMAPFKETRAYHSAREALQVKGLSIQSPLISWTAKALVRAQNVIEMEMQRQGNISSIGLLKGHPDAWGHPLRVELVHMGEYLYLIRSAGPDGKFMTGDDPIIGGLKSGAKGLGRRKDQAAPSKAAGYQSPDPSTGIRRDLLGTGRSGSGQGAGQGAPRAASQAAPQTGEDQDFKKLEEDLTELEKLLDKK